MGIESLLQQNLQNAGLAGSDRLARNAMFPQSQMDKTQYATPSQMPTSAETIRADYDTPTNAYTGLPTQPFAEGGDVDVSGNTGWDPEKGTVKLQKLSDPNDPFSDVTTIDYTVPKDDIKQFVPSIDPETNASTGAGQYILKDGSTMNIDANGIVQSATPSRNDYTLNKEGYYQPTGENLTWRGDQNMLYKKIGGVDVNVPGIYHKGGYQDQQGNLRVDANGVPVALAPNYLDSGFGQSGLADAAPYIMAAALGGAGLAIAPATGFAGMVPASETLMGGLGALGGSAGSGSWGLSPELAAELGLEGSTSGLGTSGVQGSAALESMGLNTAGEGASQGFGLKDAYKAYQNVNRAKNVMNMLNGPSGSSAAYGNQGINNPYAMQAGFNPGPVRSGLGIDSARTTSPWANLAPNISLSKLSEFAPEYSKDMAAGGIAQGGGHLGGYSDGGRLLKGPGDGMSDNIPATIGNKQPARLAEGEFVIPADVVSHLGNGSTDAGAKQLYKMMDRIRKARTGNPKQGKQINPDKFTPKG